jgi:hypothetical protein
MKDYRNYIHPIFYALGLQISCTANVKLSYMFNHYNLYSITVYRCTSGTIFNIMVILASMKTHLARSVLLGLSLDKGEIPM